MPLSDAMLVMDVADTLRHGIVSPVPPLPSPQDEQLLDRLGVFYRQQGIEAPTAVLAEGLAAWRDRRFIYQPARGFAATLAHLYVARRRWGPAVGVFALVVVVGLGGYFFGYLPYQAAQTAAAQQELTQGLPAQMDAAYEAIFNDTKVQSAVNDAEELRNRGKEAAQNGNRAAAEQAVSDLRALHDQLMAAYTLRVVDQDGVKPGFWNFPPTNAEATNYYLVVEAVDADGHILSLPIRSEDTGETKTVSRWALRVPQAVYDAVIADKNDDGVIQHAVVGFKQDGFLDVDYVVPVLGGTLTQW